MFTSLRVYQATKIKAEKLKERYGGSLVSICEGVFDAVEKLAINPLLEVEGKDKVLQSVTTAVERHKLATVKKLNELEALYLQPITMRTNEILQVLADGYSSKLLEKKPQTADTVSPHASSPLTITEDKQKIHDLQQALAQARQLLEQISDNISSNRMPGGKVTYTLNVGEDIINQIKAYLT